MNDSQNQMKEKFKELFNLSKEILNEESTRNQKLEEKASKYFSALAIMMGGIGFIGYRVINDIIPPKSFVEIFGVSLFLLILILMFISGLLVLFVFSQKNFSRINFDVDYWEKYELTAIYKAFSKENKKALMNNRKIADKKSHLLKIAHYFISAVFFLFILLIVIFSVLVYCRAR